MKRVYCVQDDSCEWYVIPYEMKDDFLNMIHDMNNESFDYDLFQEFEDKYGKYSTGSNLNLIPLYVDPDQLLNQ